MKRIVFLAFLSIFLALPAMAEEPQDFVAIGAVWNQYASPQASGSLLYAHRVGQGLYSFNFVDVTSKSIEPFLVTTCITTGLAQKLREIGPVKIYISGTIGIAGGGESIGGVWTAGGAAVIPLGKSWYLMPNVRSLKSSLSDYQGIFGIAIGWGPK